MIRERNSVGVRYLRIVQDKIISRFGFLDDVLQILFRRKARNSPLFIFVVGPPRSGTTLVYQLIRSAFQANYLTNVSNFLFTMPFLSFLFSSKVCRRMPSKFKSKFGFVSGACGEAEGLAFWRYWTGQGLRDQPELLRPKRAERLRKKLLDTGGDLFVFGFLGHSFCIDLLREVFTDSIFICTKRDLLSNAYSLYRYGKGEAVSLVPSIGDETVKPTRSKYQFTIEQIDGIHQRIKRSFDESDSIYVKYERVCRNPNDVLRGIVDLLNRNGVEVQSLRRFPETFTQSLVEPEYDELSRILNKLIIERNALD